MKIAIVGGGPGGLYFAALMKQLDAGHDISLWERDAAGETYGFGVVLSDETLGGIADAEPEFARALARRFARWTDIDIHFRGVRHTVGGQGFAAMSRVDLLGLLQERCLALGVRAHHASPAPDPGALRASHDLVVAADGVGSGVRRRYRDVFRPTLDRRPNKYMWLGTDRVFEAFQFFVKETAWGPVVAHAYPYSGSGSTFLVEMREEVWRRAGLDAAVHEPLPPGASDETSVARLRELFAAELAGHRLFADNAKWLNFTTVRNERWRHGNLVLLGDAAHTAHFSVGSGTKLAMEDALALAACLHEQPDADLPAALGAYERERRPVVESTQRAAQASLEWFENLPMYLGQEPTRFCFNLLTRSRRITYENLRTRDPGFADRVDAAFAAAQREPGAAGGEGPGPAPAGVPAMFRPFRLGGLALKNRVVVSPMDLYAAVDGLPGDLHLVHLGSKALGGAGLVMTEMVCVSPRGRITPGCTGLWNDAQRDSWARIVSFAHEHSTARIGLQLGHSGRKGSTRLMWEGMDEPLESGNWEVAGPSPLPYGPGSPVPRELGRAELVAIVEDFVAAARRGAEAGFDLLELHCAHGYLLSSFLSPLTNHRGDAYGGTLANRLRFPLEVLDAVRAVWPAGRPVTVRISASDWAPGGVTEQDAVAFARAFVAHGADAIDVSSGQVTREERPAFGRSYQTPFADRIRQEVTAGTGAAVIAVGAIASYDDVNSILLAGRADLCALGRTHLHDPQWTLHAAAAQGYEGPGADWPRSFRAGSRTPPSARTDAVRPRLSLLRAAGTDTGVDVHVRWRPREEAPAG